MPFEFFVELVSQLFHADVLIAERAGRIESLEAKILRLRQLVSPEGTAA